MMPPSSKADNGDFYVNEGTGTYATKWAAAVKGVTTSTNGVLETSSSTKVLMILLLIMLMIPGIVSLLVVLTWVSGSALAPLCSPIQAEKHW